MVLELRNLSYRSANKELFQNLNLCVEKSSLCGLVGPNGAGKTSLLRLIAGLWDPLHGDILWDNQSLLDVSPTVRSQILSFLWKQQGIPFSYLVEDLIAMGLYASRGTSILRQEDRSFLENELGALDVMHLLGRSIQELSQGERQRVFLARTLIRRTELLLLDEPFEGLDIRHQLQLWSLLQNLARDGACIIVVVHDLLAAESYCQRLCVFAEGSLHSDGLAHHVLDKTALAAIFGVQRSPEHENRAAIFRPLL